MIDTIKQVERWIVFLVAAHSAVVGLILLGVPRWAAAFGGWGAVETDFFIRQGGAFHLVVASGYYFEYVRHRTVSLLLTAKALATVFLLWSWLIDTTGAWALPLAAVGDGLMGIVVYWVHRAGRKGSSQP